MKHISINEINKNNKLNNFIERPEPKDAIIEIALDEKLPAQEVINLVDEFNREHRTDIEADEIIKELQIINEQILYDELIEK